MRVPFPHTFGEGIEWCTWCHTSPGEVAAGLAPENCDTRQEQAAKADPVTEAPGDEPL